MATTAGQARAEWARFSLEEALPSGLNELIGTLDAAVDSITPTLELATSALNILASLPEITDPLEASLNAIVTAITSILETLENTSIYYQQILPTSVAEAQNIQGTLSLIANSFLDDQDNTRPLQGEEDELAMITLIVAGSDVATLIKTLQPILTFFDTPSFPEIDASYESELAKNGGYPPTLSAGAGQDPDWWVLPISQFGQFGIITNELKKAKGLFAKIGEGTSFLQSIVAVLNAKLEQLKATSDKIGAVISSFQNVIAAAAQIAVLETSSVGNVTEVVDVLNRAAADPANPYGGLGGQEKAAAFTIAVASSDVTVITAFKSLFSFGNAVLEELQTAASAAEGAVSQARDLEKSAEDMFKETF